MFAHVAQALLHDAIDRQFDGLRQAAQLRIDVELDLDVVRRRPLLGERADGGGQAMPVDGRRAQVAAHISHVGHGLAQPAPDLEQLGPLRVIDRLVFDFFELIGEAQQSG